MTHQLDPWDEFLGFTSGAIDPIKSHLVIRNSVRFTLG